MSDDVPQTDIHGRIAARIGAPAADTFCKAFGGRQIYIPADPRRDSRVVAAMGLAAEQAISDEFGRGVVLVPLRQYATGRERLLLAGELLKAGRSNSEIAQALRCHMRTVERIKAALRREGRLA